MDRSSKSRSCAWVRKGDGNCPRGSWTKGNLRSRQRLVRCARRPGSTRKSSLRSRRSNTGTLALKRGGFDSTNASTSSCSSTAAVTLPTTIMRWTKRVGLRSRRRRRCSPSAVNERSWRARPNFSSQHLTVIEPFRRSRGSAIIVAAHRIAGQFNALRGGANDGDTDARL